MAMLADTIDGVIGVDTHRDTLTAAAVTAIGGLLADATASTDAAGYRQLLGFATSHLPGRRCWAIEGAGGLGAPLATRLSADGIAAVDVPAKLAARVRVLSTGHGRKNDDARWRSMSAGCWSAAAHPSSCSP